MRGRSTCPTEQKKHSVGATAGSPLFLLLQGKVGYRIAPSSDPASPAHLPPEGKALRCASLPVCETTSPSPPSRGAGRYGRGMQGRRPVSEHRKNLPLITDQREVGPGRREPLSALVFFPPAFFQRKPGSRPESGGKPRRRAHPAPVQKAPRVRPPEVGPPYSKFRCRWSIRMVRQ